ncbi:RNA-guided endonuclease InsQ/TnpB family protein [Alkalihalobacillus sp. NPDC078783]
MIYLNRVERHLIKKSHPMYKVIDEYCFKSKNLYNLGNYHVRQEFICSGKYINYNTLTKNLKHSEAFKSIGSNSGQHTLKLLEMNWKSFFAGIKDWAKNKEKYTSRPKLPRYLSRDGRFVWVLTNHQSKIIDGELKFSFKPLKKYNGLIKTKVTEKHMQTRFTKQGTNYLMEIVYRQENANNLLTQDNMIIGIDLGIGRFATVQNTFRAKSFAINGNKIKAVNNYYNKKLSKLRSTAKKVNNKDWTNQMSRLTTKRNNILENFMHQASRRIVNYCIEHQVDTVVVGYNERWKQGAKLGRSNQTFVQIPYLKFLNKLEYKLGDVGVRLIKTEESYTSKASFLDNDEMRKNVGFSGKRIERGLYKSSCGSYINADINGAGNIIRKVYPNAFFDGLQGVDLHPKIINII